MISFLPISYGIITSRSSCLPTAIDLCVIVSMYLSAEYLSICSTLPRSNFLKAIRYFMCPDQTTRSFSCSTTLAPFCQFHYGIVCWCCESPARRLFTIIHPMLGVYEELTSPPTTLARRRSPPGSACFYPGSTAPCPAIPANVPEVMRRSFSAGERHLQESPVIRSCLQPSWGKELERRTSGLVVLIS